jgi:replicative DNA helicase
VLRDQNLLDKVGGPAAITELFTFVPSPAHFRHYLKIVEDHHAARRNIDAHARALTEFFAPSLDLSAAITAAEEHVLGAANGIIRRMTRKTMKEAISETLDGIEEHLKLAGALPGFPTGFQVIDKATGGLRKGKVTVFAGLPSDGKSAIMQNCARVALRSGARVGWYSLEMPLPEVTARILCEVCGVVAGDLYGGIMSRAQQEMLQRSIRQLSEMGADIVETDGYTATEILADIAASNYDLAVVDYLQLMEYDGRKGATREEIIASISRRMKQVAKKSGCHILTASQLNDQGKLRESRAIGQDADNVFLVHKHPTEEGDGYDDTKRILFCEKNRGGKRHWQAPLLFNGPTFTFKEVPQDEN